MRQDRRGRFMGLTSGIALGAICCLGIILLLIASTVVLSLISLYTPDHSQEWYGEHYYIKAKVLDVQSADGSLNFTNGTVVDSAELSNLCGAQYRNQGAQYFVGCHATNFVAFGPYSNSSRRRRRRTANRGFYEVGEIHLYYSTSCPPQTNRLASGNSDRFSNCIKRRLEICNKLRNDASSWLSSLGSLAQTIWPSGSSSSESITIKNITGLSNSNAIDIAGSSNLSSIIQANIALGCQYRGPISHEDINAILSSQTSPVTDPSSTLPPT
ncbi:unnamed protein product [Adineta ricciae]|uniref:Uncharacterized protein n=1 Tax=Adineta ricciae TaxID=249248 RepID=A0A816F1R3_ADIRI|nr:unnamed protein product [Adineta ricciae]